jgi:hypothetical protein
MKILLSLLACLVIALPVLAQAPLVGKVSADPTGNACAAATHPLLYHNVGNNVNWYYCNSSNVYAALGTGTGDMLKSVYDEDDDGSPDSIGSGTVAAMEALTPDTGDVFIATDGNTDCGTGGGSTIVVCRYNGASWAIASGHVAGDGLAVSGTTLSTDSQDGGFMEDGGAVSLTCDTTDDQGQAQVMDDGDLEWCDGSGTTGAIQSVDTKIDGRARFLLTAGRSNMNGSAFIFMDDVQPIATHGQGMVRSGSVTAVAISTIGLVVNTVGPVTIQARINNNTVLTAQGTIDGTGLVFAYTTQARGIDTFVAGDLMTLYVVFDSPISASLNIQAHMELSFD